MLARSLYAAMAVLTLLAVHVPAAQAFTTDATHAVIIDGESGVVLFEKNADEPMPPASMSKLMTMFMVFERLQDGRLKLDDTFTVSEDAWRRGGWRSGSSNMCLEPGEEVSVGDLIRGVIVLSGNDASIVLAEGIAGSEPAFAVMMEERARELGLSTASLRNATGWPDPEHRISARDLATLAREIITRFPRLYAIYSEAEFGFCTESPANRFNRNPLLGSFPGADGLKTGHTDESGYGLVGSAVRDGKRRIFVFNGMETQAARAREAQRMMTAAFRDFETVTLYRPGDVIDSVPVFMGQRPNMDVTVADPVTFGYARADARKAQAEIVLHEALGAPIAVGDDIGRLQITFEDQIIADVPVVAATDIPRLGMLARAREALFALIRGTA